MKSVNPNKYNYEYISQILDYVNYKKPITIENFKFIHKYLSSLAHHKENDLVVDFGCGTGDLSFLLAIRYKCTVIGIDYSLDTIKTSIKNKESLRKSKSLMTNKIKFIHATNKNLPKLKNVACIYLADVIEHLYDEEIDLIFKKFTTWNDKNLTVVIHTDNNLYLTFVRPIIDFLNLVFKKTKFSDLKARNKWEKERHVNLTDPFKLTIKLKKYGFVVKKLEYSPITKERIRQQLAKYNYSEIIILLILFFGKLFRFLLPSFYLILSNEKEVNSNTLSHAR